MLKIGDIVTVKGYTSNPRGKIISIDVNAEKIYYVRWFEKPFWMRDEEWWHKRDLVKKDVS